MSEYDVLFYKRTQKVHKDRGVSKMDGVLKFLEGGRLLLRQAATDDSDEDSDSGEDTKKLSWKENRKLQNKKRQKKPSSVNVYSGTHRDIGPNLEDDAIVHLGSFEVQILSLRGGAAKGSPNLPATSLQKKVVAPIKKFIRPNSLLNGKAKKSSLRTNNKRIASTSKPLLGPKKTKVVHTNRSASLPSSRGLKTASKQVVRKDYSARAMTPGTATAAILPHIPLPGSIRGVLRPHQIEGVDFLWTTLQERRGCILGDEMGLGKTLMTIACIVAFHRKQREKHFVVVCPSSLTVNWANEFDKWLGKASQPKRVVIQKGGEQGLHQIRAYTSKLKRQVAKQAGQVLIVSYDLFRRHTKEFDFPAAVNLLVVDEGHKLKSVNGSQTLKALQDINSDARLCITATPIQNNLREFYQLANFCCPGVLGTDHSQFMKDFERPISTANEKQASRETVVLGKAKSLELQALVDTFLLRRLQKDVLTSLLPPRTEMLLFCRAQDAQRRAYQSLTSSSSLEPLVVLTSLRKLCCHPNLLDDSSCDDITMSGKLLVLDALLNEIHRMGGEKIVVVSQFTSVLTCIENTILKRRSLTFGRLDGSTAQAQRQNVVDTFQNTSQFCLLLSSKAGGCGLNLVGASRMVLFDPDWNPSGDIQAMGRIYRQGQKRPCFIYRLFTAGTCEEIILQRQGLKRGLSTLTLDARTKKHVASFTQEELRDCFTFQDVDCDTKTKTAGWPDYDGHESLMAQGCCDSALLGVAKGLGTATLSYVHRVTEEEISSAEVDPPTVHPPGKSEGVTAEDDDSDDGENQF